MRLTPEQRQQAIEAAAEAAYERDRAIDKHWKYTTWFLAGKPTKQFYRNQVTAPVDAVLRCVSLSATDPGETR